MTNQCSQRKLSFKKSIIVTKSWNLYTHFDRYCRFSKRSIAPSSLTSIDALTTRVEKFRHLRVGSITHVSSHEIFHISFDAVFKIVGVGTNTNP